MTVSDIKPVDWWCDKHEREREMMPRDGKWVLVCPACEAQEMKAVKTKGEGNA